MSDTWEALLDRFERDLTLEPALAPGSDGASASWRPDVDLGPLPAHLRARAERLRTAQTARIALLREHTRTVRAELDAARRIPPLHADAAVYVDRAG